MEEKNITKNEINKTKDKNKYKPFIWLYAISVIVMIGCLFHSYSFFNLLKTFTFLPSKYITYAGYGLLGFNIFFGIIAFAPHMNNLNKSLQTILCGAIAVVLALGSSYLPEYKGQLERAFTSIPEEGELAIGVYVRADSAYENIIDLEGKTIAIQSQLDADYQQYALKVINKEFSGQEAVTAEYNDIYSVIEALYAGEVDAILLNESYIEIIKENADFLTFDEDARKVYTCIQKIKLEYNSDAVGDITTEPFVVLVGGNDSWSYSNIRATTDCGRTDVNMIVVVNPNTKQLLFVSVPRDTYVALWGDSYCMDKLTHATVYSINCWKETIEKWLGLDVNYFVRINFSSVVNIVNALGGIDIENPYYFNSKAIVYTDENGKQNSVLVEFPEGKIHLNGEEALGYCRERYYVLPNGSSISDYGRNQHQTIVIKALIDQVTQVSTISHIGDLISAIDGTFATDISMDQIYALVQMQLDEMPTWDMVTTAIVGRGSMETSYAMGQSSGITYSVSIPTSESVAKAKEMIQKILNNEVLEK